MNAIAKSVVLALGMGLSAAILFGVGLIGGLTPSTGQPSLAAWLVYSVVPIVLTLVGLFVARSWPVKIFLLAECAGIVALTIDLLRLFRIL
jgi:fucose permease